MFRCRVSRCSAAAFAAVRAHTVCCGIAAEMAAETPYRWSEDTADEGARLPVKADKAKALDMFNKGEGGFLDRDLYVFCFNGSDAKAVAIGNPNAKQLIGVDARTLKDSTGKLGGFFEHIRRVPEAGR